MRPFWTLRLKNQRMKRAVQSYSSISPYWFLISFWGDNLIGWCQNSQKNHIIRLSSSPWDDNISLSTRWLLCSDFVRSCPNAHIASHETDKLALSLLHHYNHYRTEHFGPTSEIFPQATVLDGYWQHTKEERVTMFETDIPLLFLLPRPLSLFFVKISPFSLDLAFCLVLRLLSSAPGAPGSSFEEIPEQPLVGQIQFFPQLILLFHSITVYVNVHLWH